MSTPAPAAATTVFWAMSFNPNGRTSRAFGFDELDRELADSAVFSWVDIEGPDIAPMNEVLHRMGIDLVLVSHFSKPEVLPRIVERPDCLAYYLYPIHDPDRHLDTSRSPEEIEFARVILVLGADFVITYHRRSLELVDEVKGTCVESFRLAGRTPGFIPFLLLQRCLYDYAHLNLANDNFLDLLHDEGSAASREQGIKIAGQNILTIKKLAASLHIVLMLLATKRSPFISDEARASFRDMLANALAVRSSVDSSRDLLDGVLHDIQAAAASRTSEIARVLTVVSSIVLPLTLIAGIYGMNFEHMPELKVGWAYFGVLGLMAVVALSLLALFWRLGWLGGGRPRGR